MNKLVIFPLFFNFIVFFYYLLFGEGMRVSIGWILTFEIWFWVDKNFAIWILVAIITLIIIMGLNVMSSGFSTESQKITLELVGYVAFWALTSIFTLPVMNSIPYFGWILWSLFTVSYTVGVFLDISQEGMEGA